MVKDEVRRGLEASSKSIVDVVTEAAKIQQSKASLQSENPGRTVLPVISGRASDLHSSDRRSVDEIPNRQLTSSTKRALKAMTIGTSKEELQFDQNNLRLKQPEASELLSNQFMHALIKTPRQQVHDQTILS